MRTSWDKIFRPEHNQDYAQLANFFITPLQLVSFAAVIRVVTQRSSQLTTYVNFFHFAWPLNGRNVAFLSR